MRTLTSVLVLALAATGCSRSSEPKSEPKDRVEVEVDVPEISIDDVVSGLEANQLTLVDCNSEKTRKKHGILPRAILIDDEETFAASALPPDKTTKLVFYCGGPG